MSIPIATANEVLRYEPSGKAVGQYSRAVQLRITRQDELPPVSYGPAGSYVHSTDARSEILLREKARAQKLSYYLGAISRAGEIDHHTAVLCWRAWLSLRNATSSLLPVPDACPGPDGQLLFTWDRGDHHLELEVFPNGIGEFFYRNRQSDELWEHIGTVHDPIPDSVKAKLSLFIVS